MGKKSKRTRWRTLTLSNGDQSDSEDSNPKPLVLIHTSSSSSTSSTRNYYHHNNHYKSYNNSNKFPHYSSSQSTPIRKYQNDSTKSTRSNSATSDHLHHHHKTTTFNEDEYTRITTPRQDVLFKKGYLNKPKSYQTQTSTGTSSTANSTSTCTPDHQSADGTEGTDLEYESQFVFSNGFIDHNGIYYINSFEPFPFVVYNAPVCYPDYPDSRTKRYSTDSLTESVSPQNEEASSSSQNEHPLQEEQEQQQEEQEPSSGQDYYYNNESTTTTATTTEGGGVVVNDVFVDGNGDVDDDHDADQEERDDPPKRSKQKKKRRTRKVSGDSGSTSSTPSCSDSEVFKPSASPQQQQQQSEEPRTETNQAQDLLLQSLLKGPEEAEGESKYALKPDAEEFVPRTLIPSLPFDPNNVQFINFAPNFIPIHPTQTPPFFPPPGIPINFVAQPTLPPPPPQAAHETAAAVATTTATATVTDNTMVPNFINVVDQEPPQSSPSSQPQQPLPPPLSKNEIDIAKIVSKLEEEAAKQQRNHETKRINHQNHRGRYHNTINPTYSRGGRSSNPDKQPLTNGQQQQQYDQQRSSFRRQSSNPEQQQQQRKIEPPRNKVEGPRYERQQETRTKQAQITVKHTPLSAKVAPKTPPSVRTPLKNQWISVSNRKKRKNKANNEQEEKDEEVAAVVVGEEEEKVSIKNDDDQFESFDVNLLEDVVVPEPVKQDTSDPIQKVSVENKPTEEENKSVEEEKKEVQIETPPPPNSPPPTLPPLPPQAATPTAKKKSKKGTQKPRTKRIFITDNLITPNAESKPEPQEREETSLPPSTVTAVENEVPIIDAPPILSLPPTPTTNAPQTSESDTLTTETCERKSNKKKKKNKTHPPVTVTAAASLSRIQSVSSSTTTLNSTAMDDSYDFLLENSVLEDFDHKTNVEISRELDRIIQKGMYSSLEEKIRTLNVTVADDGFFRTIDFRYQPTKIEKPNFGVLPKNNDPFELSSTAAAERRSVPSDAFLDEDATTTATITIDDHDHDDDIMTKKGEKNKRDETKFSTDYTKQFSVATLNDDCQQQRHHHPITQAVKDWMARTRENTPDIEILKSPNTIFKEFCDTNGRRNLKNGRASSVTSSRKEGSKPPSITSSNDEEVTVWSVEEEELLNCWDDTATENHAPLSSVEETEGDRARYQNGCNGHIEEGEEAIEVYESKYGKNEDYLKIKAEIEEKQKNVGLPKHGNLPYRAICCSVM